MENLPNEILFRVFKHLRQQDLIRVTRVCKRFCSVVDEFCLIKKLVISSNNDESLIPARNYSGATFKTFKPNIHQRVIETVGGGLTTLKLSQFSLNLIDINNILRVTPNVKFLTFDYIRLEDDSISDTSELPQLFDIILLFNESDPTIFRVLQKSSILKVDLRFYGDIPYSNFVEFTKLLKIQKNLASFLVSGLYESNLFLIPMTKPTYQLKEFKIDNCDLEEWELLDNYLMEQTKTLEKLVVKSVAWDPSTILNQCKMLKSFENFRVEMNSLEIRPTIEELWLEPTSVLRDQFPNVKKLFVCGASSETFQSISTTMNKLEDITIKYGSVVGLEVPRLKKVKLISLDGLIDSNFFVVHKNIQELVFEHVYNIDDALLESITSNCSKLRVLKIFGDNQLTSRAFHIISGNCHRLKVLEMSKFDQKFTTDDWKCLFEINGLQVFQETFA